MGKEKRPKHQAFIPPTPGPGQYESQNSTQGPKFTALGRREPNVKLSPGPGEYNPRAESVQRTAEHFRVGLARRTLLKALNNNPGPGDHKNFSQLRGPKFSFGSQERL